MALDIGEEAFILLRQALIAFSSGRCRGCGSYCCKQLFPVIAHPLFSQQSLPPLRLLKHYCRRGYIRLVSGTADYWLPRVRVWVCTLPKMTAVGVCVCFVFSSVNNFRHDGGNHPPSPLLVDFNSSLTLLLYLPLDCACLMMKFQTSLDGLLLITLPFSARPCVCGVSHAKGAPWIYYFVVLVSTSHLPLSFSGTEISHQQQ